MNALVYNYFATLIIQYGIQANTFVIDNSYSKLKENLIHITNSYMVSVCNGVQAVLHQIS